MKLALTSEQLFTSRMKPFERLYQCFLSGSRDRKFGILKFLVYREICVEFPAIFSYFSKDFRGTDIHHSDIKNALLQSYNVFGTVERDSAVLGY